MYNSEIEVSYFAAGIAAHLASDENLDWSKVVMEKNQIVTELVCQDIPYFYLNIHNFVLTGGSRSILENQCS